jgi:hypothetical protein
MFFLAAAGGAQQGINGIDPTSIVNQIGSFLPLEKLAGVVDQAMSTMNTIGLCLIIIATVQEIPRTQGGEFFNVILRAIIALAVMAIITPLMWGGEVLVQNLVSQIAGNFVKNPVDFKGFGPVPGGRPLVPRSSMTLMCAACSMHLRRRKFSMGTRFRLWTI